VSLVFFQVGFNLSRLAVFRARANATPFKSSEESLLYERYRFLPALEEIDIVELAELEGELEGGL